MKKISLLVLSLFIVFIVTGCGEKKLSCSILNPGNNMNADSTVEYYFDGDNKITKANVKADFKDMTIENIDEVWDSLVSQFTSQNEPVEEEGYKRTVSSDDKNHIFTVKIEIDYNKASKETLDKYGIADFSNKTYDEIKELSEADGMKCN